MLFLGLEPSLLARLHLDQNTDKFIDFLDYVVAGLELGECYWKPLEVLKNVGGCIVRECMCPPSKELKTC